MPDVRRNTSVHRHDHWLKATTLLAAPGGKPTREVRGPVLVELLLSISSGAVCRTGSQAIQEARASRIAALRQSVVCGKRTRWILPRPVRRLLPDRFRKTPQCRLRRCRTDPNSQRCRRFHPCFRSHHFLRCPRLPRCRRSRCRRPRRRLRESHLRRPIRAPACSRCAQATSTKPSTRSRSIHSPGSRMCGAEGGCSGKFHCEVLDGCQQPGHQHVFWLNSTVASHFGDVPWAILSSAPQLPHFEGAPMSTKWTKSAPPSSCQLVKFSR